MIIGDLNMNPFEHGMIAADGIHGISDRRIAAKGTRQVGKKLRRYFYNPMWNHFGDGLPAPPGTYYYDSSSQVNHYWNIFDQVLIRPELLDGFNDENLKVVTEIDSTSLLKESGCPDRSNSSIKSTSF